MTHIWCATLANRKGTVVGILEHEQGDVYNVTHYAGMPLDFDLQTHGLKMVKENFAQLVYITARFIMFNCTQK